MTTWMWLTTESVIATMNDRDSDSHVNNHVTGGIFHWCSSSSDTSWDPQIFFCKYSNGILKEPFPDELICLRYCWDCVHEYHQERQTYVELNQDQTEWVSIQNCGTVWWEGLLSGKYCIILMYSWFDCLLALEYSSCCEGGAAVLFLSKKFLVSINVTEKGIPTGYCMQNWIQRKENVQENHLIALQFYRTLVFHFIGITTHWSNMYGQWHLVSKTPHWSCTPLVVYYIQYLHTLHHFIDSMMSRPIRLRSFVYDQWG